MITYHGVKQRSPEWFKLREGKWTGSTAIRLLQGKSLKNESSNFTNPAMMRGQLLEPAALREYSVMYKSIPRTVGFVTNSKYPNAGYSPDGIDGKILPEIKCLNGHRYDALITGEIPMEYIAQIQFGLLICELEKARLLAFNPEREQQLTVIDINRDEEIINNIIKHLELDIS